MKNLKLLAGATLALLVSASLPAFAASANTNFQVKINVTNACDAAALAVGDVDFGNHSFLDSNITASSNLSVKCTNGAPFTLSLDAGTNPATAGDTTTRRMKLAASASYVPYNLFSDSALATSWGDTVASGQVAGVGTGAAQTFPVYGKALLGNVIAGAYTDQVQATVTY